MLSFLAEYLFFLKRYFKSRLEFAGNAFESLKDIVVAILVVGRGKYSITFLNSIFFVISTILFSLGPLISQYNPFLKEEKRIDAQVLAVEYNPWEASVETEFSVKPRDRIINYKVRKGDTLSKIAKKFGITVETIKWANNLKGDRVKVGQVLKIPPVSGVVHKVKPGETIYSIAKKYKVDPQNIVNFPFNEFADPDTFALRPGQILYVPGGVIVEKKRTSPVSKRRYLAQVQAGVKGTGNFIWPATGRITQYPTWYHMAVDIANRSAPNIISADSGTVVYAGCLRYGYGCHVVIDHGNGFRTLYAHLSQIYVSVGQRVIQGQAIGRMGSTGRSTGTHLHFEIRRGRRLLNPLKFLR